MVIAVNENPNLNRRDPGKPGAAGGFKVNIDERDLATGTFDPAQYPESRPSYGEPAPSKTSLLRFRKRAQGGAEGPQEAG